MQQRRSDHTDVLCTDLTDGVGLDGAAGVTNLLGSTFTLSLTAVLTEMSQSAAQGGAGIRFDATAPDSAVVNLKAEMKFSYSSSDAMGRSEVGGVRQLNGLFGPALYPERATNQVAFVRRRGSGGLRFSN